MLHRGLSSLARASRVFLAGTLVAGLFAVVGGVPAAHAATCDTSWTNAAGGDWNTAGNWSAGVPDGTKNACITLAGTYTVTLNTQLPALSLTLGAATGTQTLNVQALCGQFATLTLGADSTIKPHGVLLLDDNAVSCGAYASRLTQSAGTLTNNGVLHVLAGAGGTPRYLDGALANGGTLTVDTLLHATTAATITNTGTVNVANGATLSVEAASFLNNSGTIAAAGTGGVSVQNGAYTQGGGTTSGTSTTPVQVLNGSLHYTGNGASTITQFGNPTNIDGNIAAGQTLTMAARNGNYAVLNAGASWSNAGTINLTDIDPNGGNYYAQLNTTSGTLTNTGTIHVAQGTATSTDRHLYGNIANSGTITIDKPVSTNGGTITNTGTVNLATGATFSVLAGAFLNNSGTIAATGSGAVFVQNGAYTQGNGTTSGTAPVLVLNGALHFTGTGASTISQYGNPTSIDGDIAAGQALNMSSQCGQYAIVHAAASWTNAGTINLTSSAAACGDYYDELSTATGTLTNTGTIHVVASDTARHLYGNITNSGTLTVDRDLATNGAIANSSTVNIATGATVTATGSFANNAGTVNATGSGTLVLPSATYTQGAGTTSGTSTVPVQVLNSGTVAYTGAGASTVLVDGNVSNVTGNIASGQTLNVSSRCGTYAIVHAASSWTNAGTINLTSSAAACGDYYDELNTTSGTLTNTGTIHVVASDTTRHLYGAVTNNGTLVLDAGVNLVRSGAISNGASGTIEQHIASPTVFGHISGSGAVHLDGTLAIVTSYTPAAGDKATLISGGGETGSFATITGQAVPGGLGYKVKSAASGTTLQVKKAADLNVVGSAPTPVGTGTQFSYTFTVANAGPKASGNVKLVDNLPAGVTFVSASAGCTLVAARVTCVLPTIASGGSTIVTITVTAGAPAANLFNTGSVSAASTVDFNQADNSSRVKVKII